MIQKKTKNIFTSLATSLGIALSSTYVLSEVYLTIEQVQQAFYQQSEMTPIDIVLTKTQMKAIAKASKTRVRNNKLKAWKTKNGGWLIVDQVVGKHEMIDFAVALNPDGSVKGVEILTYRETYGDQVRTPKWLAQFINKRHTDHLKLDKQIKNISGATLSSKHVTDGVNRLTNTWNQVLRHL
jgi:Na+-translocating ferredoxin:NAD+ oxidoreductase RnfG subunit